MKEEMHKEMRRFLHRYGVLKLIKEKPTYGYEIIKTFELRTNGLHIPSAGTIYPILKSLKSENFIQSKEIDRKKIYSITPAGIAAFDHMTREILELLKEMLRLINTSNEINDNKESGCDDGNNLGKEQQSEAIQEKRDESDTVK